MDKNHWSRTILTENGKLAVFFNKYCNALVQLYLKNKDVGCSIIAPNMELAVSVLGSKSNPCYYMTPHVIIYDPVTKFNGNFPKCDKHQLDMSKRIFNINVPFTEDKNGNISKKLTKIAFPLKVVMSDTTYPLLLIDVTYQCCHSQCQRKKIGTDAFFDQFIIGNASDIDFFKTQQYVVLSILLEHWIHALSNTCDITSLAKSYSSRVQMMHNLLEAKYIEKECKAEGLQNKFPIYWKSNHYKFIKTLLLGFFRSDDAKRWIHYLRAMQVQRPVSNILDSKRIISIDHSFESVKSSKQKQNAEYTAAFNGIFTIFENEKGLIFRLVNSKANQEVEDVLQFLEDDSHITGTVSDQARQDESMVARVCGEDTKTYQDKWHSIGRILKVMNSNSKSHYGTLVKRLKQIFHLETSENIKVVAQQSIIGMIAALNSWELDCKPFNKSPKFWKQVKRLKQDILDGYFKGLPPKKATSVNECYHKHLNAVFKHCTQIGVELFVVSLVLWFTLQYGKDSNDNSDDQPLTYSRFRILKNTNKLDPELEKLKLPPMWSINSMREECVTEAPKLLERFDSVELDALISICLSTWERVKLIQNMKANISCMFHALFIFDFIFIGFICIC